MNSGIRLFAVCSLIFLTVHVVLGSYRCMTGQCPKMSSVNDVREYEDDFGVRHITIGDRDYTKAEWDRMMQIKVSEADSALTPLPMTASQAMSPPPKEQHRETIKKLNSRHKRNPTKKHND